MVHLFQWIFRNFSGTDCFLITAAVIIAVTAFVSMVVLIIRSGHGSVKAWFFALLERTAENAEAWNLSVHEEIEKLPSAYEDWADEELWKKSRVECGRTESCRERRR